MVDDNSEHKKAKGANKNVVARISHNENRVVLLINKWRRHLMSRIQKKKTTEQELMKSIKFDCLGLMIDYISKTMDMID